MIKMRVAGRNIGEIKSLIDVDPDKFSVFNIAVCGGEAVRAGRALLCELDGFQDGSLRFYADISAVTVDDRTFDSTFRVIVRSEVLTIPNI
jgi:hypothetical protein